MWFEKRKWTMWLERVQGNEKLTPLHAKRLSTSTCLWSWIQAINLVTKVVPTWDASHTVKRTKMNEGGSHVFKGDISFDEPFVIVSNIVNELKTMAPVKVKSVHLSNFIRIFVYKASWSSKINNQFCNIWFRSLKMEKGHPPQESAPPYPGPPLNYGEAVPQPGMYPPQPGMYPPQPGMYPQSGPGAPPPAGYQGGLCLFRYRYDLDWGWVF